MSVDENIARLIAVAKAEIGYLEKETNSYLDDKTANAGDNNYTKYARDLAKLGFYNGNKNGYFWCDVFVDWCFVKTFGADLALKITNQSKGGYGASCTASAGSYKSMGRFYKIPNVGDQIFFTDNGGEDYFHTGLVSKVTSDRVYTIEGNTSTASGVVDNGGGVAEKSYPLNYRMIGGYGRPNYSIIDMEDEDMTVERFKELMKEYRDELQDNDSAKWSKNAREWAVSSGMIAGGGDGKYMWEDFLTREQMATMLYRFAQYIGKV